MKSFVSNCDFPRRARARAVSREHVVRAGARECAMQWPREYPAPSPLAFSTGCAEDVRVHRGAVHARPAGTWTGVEALLRAPGQKR